MQTGNDGFPGSRISYHIIFHITCFFVMSFTGEAFYIKNFAKRNPDRNCLINNVSIKNFGYSQAFCYDLCCSCLVHVGLKQKRAYLLQHRVKA